MGISNRTGSVVDIVNDYLTQSEWHIDPVAGDDTLSGVDVTHPIKTWDELRRRMNGGPQSTSTIFVYGDLSYPRFDWSTENRLTVVTIDFAPAMTVLHSGSYTSAPIVRDPTTSSPAVLNRIIDAGMPDWTPYQVSDSLTWRAAIIVPTNGPASGIPTWVVRKVGGNVDVGAYIDAGAEYQPLNGNTYEVRRLAKCADYFFAPTGPGTVVVKWAALGDPLTSVSGSNCLAPANSVQMEFHYCQIFVATTQQGTGYLTFVNCSTWIGPNMGSPCSWYAGCAILEAGGYRVIETEAGSDLALDYGFVSFGFEWNVTNGGHARIYEACFLDSATYALGVDDGSTLRVTQAWGDGNVASGIRVAASGYLAVQTGDLSTVTGAVDVELNGIALTWAEITAADAYITDTMSAATITRLS